MQLLKNFDTVGVKFWVKIQKAKLEGYGVWEIELLKIVKLISDYYIERSILVDKILNIW